LGKKKGIYKKNSKRASEEREGRWYVAERGRDTYEKKKRNILCCC